MIKGKYIIKSDDKVICEKDNLITTNGFLAINRFLTKGSMDWAGSLVVGGLTNIAKVSDKTLYYETARVPVTLKSYTKFNPKYLITNKQLSASAVITSVTGTGSVVTYTTQSAHNFLKNQIVTTTGLVSVPTPAGWNLTATILDVPTTTTFTVSNATTGTYGGGTGSAVVNTAVLTFQSVTTPTIDVGYKIQVSGVDATFNGTYSVNRYDVVSLPTTTNAGTYTIMYSKTASSVSSTAVSSNNSILSVTYDANTQPVYNNEIILKGTLNPALALQINEIGAIPLSISSGAFKDNVFLTDFSETLSTDTSLSQWTVSSTPTSLVGVTSIQGSTSSPTGYSWANGSSTATFNVSSTMGMKAGNSVYLSGVTSVAGTTPSGTYTISQVNGNYQVILTMGSASTGTWGGYGGTMSINSTSQAQPSYTGQFNIKLAGATTATLSNLSYDATGYSTSDSLLLLYYATAPISAQTLTITLTDSLNATNALTSTVNTSTSTINTVSGSGSTITYTTTANHNFATGQYVNVTGYTGVTGYNVTAAQITVTSPTSFTVSNATTGTPTGTGSASVYGWTIQRIPLTNFTSASKIINKIAVGLTGSVAVFLDGLKFSTGSYWSAHPLSGSSLITLPSEYQLSSRSVFANPVIKTPGQQMDIEYHIQVT